MTFINYLGICILVWLFLGFATAIKNLYLDKVLSKENLDKTIEDARNTFPQDESFEKAIKLLQNKKVFITVTTLMGGIAFIADTIGTFSGKNKKDKEGR